MKNLFNKFATVLVAVAFIFTFTSCEKEDITPDNVNNPTEVVATDDYVTTEYNTAKTVNVLTNDEGIDISVLGSTSNPTNGTITRSGNTFTYTPDATFSGSDSFTYEITDLTGVTDVATVTITVLTENVVITNTDPTFNGSISLTSSNSSLDVASFLYDVDGDVVTIEGVGLVATGSSNGTVSVSGTTITYTPDNALWAGTENLAVTISDSTSTVTTNVTLNYGSTAQIATYNLISQYFGNTFSEGIIDNLTLNSDGTLTSEINDNFYGVNATSATYVILENGKIRMNVSNVGAIFREFEVTELDDFGVVGLIFTGLGVNNNTVNLKVWN